MMAMRRVRKGSERMSLRFALAVGALMLATIGAAAEDAGPARFTGESGACHYGADVSRFQSPLPRLSARLVSGLPVTIVAIGSSSTAGAGASTPAASYPSRLAADLTKRLHYDRITVVNRGVNGEEAGDMIKRFDSEVLSEKPDLVLWQVGVNGLLRETEMDATVTQINEGIQRLKAAGADVVLIDPQYAPKVLAKASLNDLLARFEIIAQANKVQLFHRFALMRAWHDANGMSFDKFVSPDGLHMNDWSYACLATALGVAIAEAGTRPTATAAAHPPR